MLKKSLSLLLLFTIMTLFFFCESEEDKLKKSDPLFYDTNNELIKMTKDLPLGTTEDEIKKIYRLQDPAMEIIGRGGVSVTKHVFTIKRSKKDSTVTIYRLGDVSSVPNYYILTLRFRDGKLFQKDIHENHLKMISRYRGVKKIYPDAKPRFYKKQ